MSAMQHTDPQPWVSTRPARGAAGERDDDLARARRLAGWLDDRFLDPILGFLFPGAGDLLTSAAGLFTLAVAARRKLPPVVIARMLLNLALDSALGAIPFVGDLFDVFFRAHRRNLRLLESRAPTGRARPSDWLLVGGAVLLFLAALVLPIVLLVLTIRALIA